jgi:hypothetical protein
MIANEMPATQAWSQPIRALAGVLQEGVHRWRATARPRSRRANDDAAAGDRTGTEASVWCGPRAAAHASAAETPRDGGAEPARRYNASTMIAMPWPPPMHALPRP